MSVVRVILEEEFTARRDEFSQSSSGSCSVFFFFSLLRRFRMIDDEHIVVIDRMFSLRWECCIVLIEHSKRLNNITMIFLYLLLITVGSKLIFRSVFSFFSFFSFLSFSRKKQNETASCSSISFFISLFLTLSPSYTKNLVQRDIMYHFNCQLLK